jgi:hypothetical protein
MLQVFYLDMMLHMLLWLYMYVASVHFKCLSCFKRMLQMFYVLNVSTIFKRMLQFALAIHRMLQV